MKKRHSEEQIIRILREAEKNEVPLREVCRQHNVTANTISQDMARCTIVFERTAEMVETKLIRHGVLGRFKGALGGFPNTWKLFPEYHLMRL